MLLCIRGTWYTRTTAISTWEYEYFSCNLCNYGFHHVFFNVRLAAVQCNIFKLHFYTDQMLWYTPWNKNALIIIFSLSHPTDSLSLILLEKIRYLCSNLCRIFIFCLKMNSSRNKPLVVCGVCSRHHLRHITDNISNITIVRFN